MKGYVLALVCLALVLPSCSKQKGASSSSEAQTASADDMERPEIPPHKEARETAAAGGEVYEPRRVRTAQGAPAGSGTAPGTTKALAPGQGTFTRSSAPLSAYQLEQGTAERDLKTTQRIHRAMAQDAKLPLDGAAVTVITHGGKTVLFGKVPNEDQRSEIEALARRYSSDVESHVEIAEPEGE